tara:strand:- start:818 stop:1417 length:600 start_codon:yes stop_codon:yes gene_type:complete
MGKGYKKITDFKTFEDLENILSAHGGWGKFERLILSTTEEEFSDCSKAEIDALLTCAVGELSDLYREGDQPNEDIGSAVLHVMNMLYCDGWLDTESDETFTKCSRFDELKMNKSCKYISLDQLAECYEGISRDLRKKLWNLIPSKKETLSSEERAERFENSYQESRNDGTLVSSHWSKFTSDEKRAINSAIEKEEEQYA